MSIQQRIKQRRFRNSTEESFVSILFAGTRIVQRIEDACEAHGITHTQYNVLRILRGVHPEGHPRCEIAERLIGRAPDVTRLLDRLEQGKLIARNWSKENRRLSIATITAKGLELLRKMDPVIEALEKDTTGRLTAAEQTALVRICDRMVGAEK
ncbi:MAG: MarR family transcriptional regulator [Acidobacteria bacterium]|nr:MarR family transcriptional regulator [Acidobacteriota bacterium]